MKHNTRNNTEILDDLVKQGAITESERNQLKPRRKGTTYQPKLVAQATKSVIKKPKDEEEKSWNKTCTNHIFKVAKITKPDLDSPNSVNRAIMSYFSIVEADAVKPSVSGLAMALGISREQLKNYANGTTRVGGCEIIRQALQALEVFDEMSLRDSTNAKSNPVALMFLMKNNHGYTDKTEVVHSENNQELSEKEIAKKYSGELEIIEATESDDK